MLKLSNNFSLDVWKCFIISIFVVLINKTKFDNIFFNCLEYVIVLQLKFEFKSKNPLFHLEHTFFYWGKFSIKL